MASEFDEMREKLAGFAQEAKFSKNLSLDIEIFVDSFEDLIDQFDSPDGEESEREFEELRDKAEELESNVENLETELEYLRDFADLELLFSELLDRTPDIFLRKKFEEALWAMRDKRPERIRYI